MALWKDQVKPSPSDTTNPARFDASPGAEARADSTKSEPVKTDAFAQAPGPGRSTSREKARSESLIAPDIAIEGKIEGSGHVRIAGRFKGDVNVQGDLTIEAGAQVTGSVRADKVVVAGELVGNIEAASHVELMQSGALSGDLKAESLSVAAGSRMRGQAEFGWENAKTADSAKNGADRTGASHGTIP